jgi:hypothetical protein
MVAGIAGFHLGCTVYEGGADSRMEHEQTVQNQPYRCINNMLKPGKLPEVLITAVRKLPFVDLTTSGFAGWGSINAVLIIQR